MKINFTNFDGNSTSGRFRLVKIVNEKKKYGVLLQPRKI